MVSEQICWEVSGGFRPAGWWRWKLFTLSWLCEGWELWKSCTDSMSALEQGLYCPGDALQMS